MVENSNLRATAIMSLDEWKLDGNYFSYQGYNIFFRTNNAHHPTLFLLHGFPTSSWDYSYLWKGLERQFNLLAIDMLGFGFSDKPINHNYSTGEQVDLIEAILSSKGINKIHILAHDYGDTVVQEMIARYEEKNNMTDFTILSVCFLNGGLFPESHTHTFLQGLLAGQWGGIASHFITKKRAYRALSELFGKKYKPSNDELDILWRLISYKQGNKISHKLLQYINERRQFRERWVGALEKTAIAMRFISGPDDPVSGINMVESYRKIISNPDVVLLEGVGHFPHIEVPELVLEAYLEFYQRITI